jgi:murein DD-endopeptidase MepM/ murein hydrolase activator NlpD
MPRPRHLITLLLASLAALALAAAPASLAAEPVPAPAGPATETTSPAPAPEAPAPTAPAPTTSTEAPAAPEAGAPQVQTQFSQGATPSHPSTSRPSRGSSRSGGSAGEAVPGEGASQGPRSKHPAAAPSTLTPALPFSLQSSLVGVPGFFIESFQVPPFLLPIFQAAGTAYGVPWQVLAAINEVETDYGRDLSVSSAGAEGWMQFLPAEWAQYGVDANGDGFKDPYNPADAIFAAARYLRAAGGNTSIRTAVFSYNHSQAYVDSVMLRAQLLGGTPSELLGAITGLTEARFPVHAAAHFSDGFPTVPAAGSGPVRTLAGTSIYAQAGAPVIAVQDGEVVQIGQSAALGRFLVLRDAFGNTYTYGQLGDVSALYPVLEPHVNSTVSSRISQGRAAGEAPPSGPATAGAQPRSPVSDGATVSGLALGAAAALEAAPALQPAPVAPPAPAKVAAKVSVFRAGSNDVFLHALLTGVQVIAGTVLGHVGAGGGSVSASEAQPHIVFQIRPSGVGAPLIDPKPILDGWVALENSSIFRAKGENPFLATSPTIGQVLLESKQQLEPQVLRDSGIRLGRCGRQDVQTGTVDKRVLALLEYMSVSGLKPTVSGLECAGAAQAAGAANASAGSTAEAVNITAVNGVPVAGHQGQGSVTDAAVRRLLMLQGAARPQRIASLLSYPGDAVAFASPGARDAIRVAFSATVGAARTAGLAGSALSPSEWTKLVARLGEIPDPTVARAPSAAALPDSPGAVGGAGGGESGGNH